MAESVLSEDIRIQKMQTMNTGLEENKKRRLTSCCFFLSGVPQGFNPPEKLGKLRQTIDLMLYNEINSRLSSDHQHRLSKQRLPEKL